MPPASPRHARSLSRCAPGILLLAGLASTAAGQAIGPDMISSSHVDVARNGSNAAGTIVGYSVGSITCNIGDLPADTHPNSSIRPLVGQQMYRYRSFTAPGSTVSFSRMEQIGQGWVKWVGIPVNGSSATCGTGSCSPGGSGQMGPNCADTYSSGFNGPTGMARRSFINAATGVLSGARGGGTGETTINTRLQVLASDLAAQPQGTRFFIETVHLLPHDAQYLRPGQNVAINAMNNASSQEIGVNGGVGNATLIGGAANRQIPVIARWRELDPTVTLVTADHDDTPNPSRAGAFIRCRFYVAAKVTDLLDGRWRYEYAVYNLNSDRSAGSFTLPMHDSTAFTDYFFRHAPTHSGEAISNAPWTATKAAHSLVFATQTFAANPAANAIRWGTMYNFGFTAPVPPTTGEARLGLFKPGTLADIAVPGLPVPSLPPVCAADFNGDGSLDPDDLSDFIGCFFQSPACDGMDINDDGNVDPDDLSDYIGIFFAGC